MQRLRYVLRRYYFLHCSQYTIIFYATCWWNLPRIIVVSLISRILKRSQTTTVKVIYNTIYHSWYIKIWEYICCQYNECLVSRVRDDRIYRLYDLRSRPLSACLTRQENRKGPKGSTKGRGIHVPSSIWRPGWRLCIFTVREIIVKGLYRSRRESSILCPSRSETARR